MRANATATLLWFSISKLLFPFLICFMFSIGIFADFLNYSTFHALVINAIEFIPLICASLITSLGLIYKKVIYPQFNLIFIFPYSLFSVFLLREFFSEFEFHYFQFFAFLSYFFTIFAYNFLVIPDIKKKPDFIKVRNSFMNMCLSLYLFPLLFYNIDLPLVDLSQRRLVLLIILILNVLFYLHELLRICKIYREYKKQRTNNIYKKQRIKGIMDFCLLSQILGWTILGTSLSMDISNWYIIFPFVILANMSYIFGSLESFRRKSTRSFLVVKTGRFLIFGSIILVLFTLVEIQKSENAYDVLFSISVFFMLLGNIFFGSLLTDWYKKINIFTYFGILLGLFYVIVSLPSDFLPEIPLIEDKQVILYSLTTIIQSLVTIFAILVTFVTFIFTYIWSTKIGIGIFGKEEKQAASEEEISAFGNVDVTLLIFILICTLSIGYRLLKVILLAFRTIPLVQENILNLSFDPNIIREAQACFWVVLLYIHIVVSILFIFHILPRIPPDRILHTRE